MVVRKQAEMDVVYFVKESKKNEELRYSLRSVEQNLPHRSVWIYGGKPDDINPDHFVPVNQTGATKWDKVRTMFRSVCNNPDISDDFVLFNDDFFVINPVEEVKPYYRSSLYEHIIKLERAFGDKTTEYSKELRKCAKALEDAGITDIMSYELHIPMVLNKKELLKTMVEYPDVHATRTLYGNRCRIGGEQRADVKITSILQEIDKDIDFLSSDDGIFENLHSIGGFIRKKFDKPSRFEEVKNGS